MKTCKYGCGGKMKSGGKVTSIKKKYQDGGPTLADLEKKDRRNILGGLSAKLGIGTATAGIAAIAGKKISDTVKKNREENKEVKGMVKNIVKKAKSTKVMQKGGSTKMQMGGYAKPQMGGDNTKMGIYGVPNAGRTDALGFKKGGAVKKAKLAAMAPPKGKITRADIITAAKRNAKKKK